MVHPDFSKESGCLNCAAASIYAAKKVDGKLVSKDHFFDGCENLEIRCHRHAPRPFATETSYAPDLVFHDLVGAARSHSTTEGHEYQWPLVYTDGAFCLEWIPAPKVDGVSDV